MWVQMNVNTILFDSKNSSYIVVLKDESGKKILPIWIGASEGNSIALAMSNVKAARPLTHDLIVSIFDRLEIEIARVVISDLIDNTFYASLYLLQNSKEFHIDSRPSDAIAIAIRIGAPVFVEEDVLAKQDQSTLDTWMKNLGEGGRHRIQCLTPPPDLNAYHRLCSSLAIASAIRPCHFSPLDAGLLLTSPASDVFHHL